ncbi:efflux RND transporter permease subunit [Candidatus Poribacteria bacterium]|nr:efflux RND transporter permease subunit [Candidatus Poribacteria bacterium]
MNLSDIAIKRPITTFMVFIAIVIVGVFSLSRLSIDLMPDVEFPSLTVSTSYPGASPKEVETLITEPMERAVSTVQNIEEVRSTSSEGQSTVTVDFTWGTDMTEAVNDLRERVARVKGALPEDVTEPMVWKFDASTMPIMHLGLSGNMPPDKLRRYAEDEIQYRLEQIEGVAAVNIRGGLEREIHVDVDRSQLEAVGLSFSRITSALMNENLDEPGGYLETERTELLMRTSGQYTNIAQIANTVVGHQNGAPIYLHQVADVTDSFKERRSETRLKGEPGISISIQKQPGENTVRVSDRALKRVEAINQTLPAGMQLFVTRDNAVFIRNSITQIQQSAIIGGFLAVFILFVFLRNVRSTLIISTAIPIAVIAAFILMNFAGLTLNMMSMGGLALGIGMLLDNAIVVLENIFRHREWGEEANQAASVGTKEVSGAISASTLTTLCVFFPLLFAGGGMQGVFFSQLAYTVSFSLLASLFVALTLVPVMSAKFLHVKPTSEAGIWSAEVSASAPRQQRLTYSRFKQRIAQSFDALNDKYRDALDWTLSHRLWVMIICPLALVLTLAMIPTIGTELMPQVDEGNLSISIQLPVGTKFQITDALAKSIEKVVQASVPEIKTMRTNVGGGGWFGGRSSHTANVDIDLVDKKERQRSTEEVMADLRRKFIGIPDARIWISSRGSMMTRMMGGQEERIEVDVRGHDLETGAILAEQVKEIVESVEGTVNVRVSREEGKPELTVVVDRDKSSALGLNLATVADTLNTGLTGRVATRYREGGDEFDVRVRLKEKDRLSLDNVKTFFLHTGANSTVALNNIAQIQERVGPISIQRRNQERIITVSASIAGRDFGSITKEINEKLASLNAPEGFTVRPTGEQEEQQKAFRSLVLVLMLAIALVYMVMASQFESLLHPFVIMFSIPFATIGVILILFLTGTNFSITVFIGIIMLAGIVVNNAIVLVDYINLMRRQGLAKREAILESGRRRLRPILMTTLTTVLALAPMSFGIGAGAELQAPMARTVLGGLTIATLFTLFFIPTLYSLFEDAREKLGGRI